MKKKGQKCEKCENAKKCLKKYEMSLGRVVEFENEWGVVKRSEFKIELSENG